MEGAWLILKGGVKSEVALKLLRVLAGVRRGHATQTEFRSVQLVIANNLPLIRLPKCTVLLTHVQRFIHPAWDLEDMNF